MENGKWKFERKWRMGGIKKWRRSLSEWKMNAYIELGEGWLEVENLLEISWGCCGHFMQLPKVVRSLFVEV